MNYPELRNTKTGSVIQVNKNPFLIGRGFVCSHIIQSNVVSRIHCRLVEDNSNWTVTDTSTNGTIINGKYYNRTQSLPLQNGDLITLGEDNVYQFNSNLVVEIPDDKIPTPTPTIPSPTRTVTPQNVPEPSTSEVIEVENIPNKRARLDPSGSEPDNADALRKDLMEDDLVCSICQEMFVKATTANCSHTYCLFCIQRWRENSNLCPICRTAIVSTSPTLIIDNLIDKIVQGASAEVKEQRNQLIIDRTTPHPAAQAARKSVGTLTSIVFEINSSDEEHYDSSSYSSSDLSDIGSFGSIDSDVDEHADYNGLPGVYYGGYGRCFLCNGTGHWSNGCPN